MIVDGEMIHTTLDPSTAFDTYLYVQTLPVWQGRFDCLAHSFA